MILSVLKVRSWVPRIIHSFQNVESVRVTPPYGTGCATYWLQLKLLIPKSRQNSVCRRMRIPDDFQPYP